MTATGATETRTTPSREVSEASRSRVVPEVMGEARKDPSTIANDTTTDYHLTKVMVQQKGAPLTGDLTDPWNHPGYELGDDGESVFIRPSTVDSAMLCGGRVGLRGNDGYRYLPNEGLMFGSAVHWWIEFVLEHEREPTIDEVLDVIDELYLKDYPRPMPGGVALFEVPSQFLGSRSLLAFAAEVLEAGESWLSTVYSKLLVGHDADEFVIEERLTADVGIVDLGNGEQFRIYLRGTPDLIIPSIGEMIDWKTAGKAWDPKRLEKQFQVVVYPWMASEHLAVEIEKFTYWIYDRSGKWWVPMSAPVGTKAERKAARHQTLRVAHSLLSDSWTYRPQGQGRQTRGWHCSPKYCDAWAVCPGKHLVRDGKANEPALVGKEAWA